MGPEVGRLSGVVSPVAARAGLAKKALRLGSTGGGQGLLFPALTPS